MRFAGPFGGITFYEVVERPGFDPIRVPRDQAEADSVGFEPSVRFFVFARVDETLSERP